LSSQVAFKILSQVQYTGSFGDLDVVLAVPSEAAVSQGLDLGNPIGALADGTRLYGMQFVGDASEFPTTYVSYFKGGYIVQLAASTSLDALKRYASAVAVS